jgi:esterase/lipase superfamily enzyme
MFINRRFAPSLCAALAFGLLAAWAAPAFAECKATAGNLLFITDREPAEDAQVFTGERGIATNRHQIISRGVIANPIGKPTESLCSSKDAFFNAISSQFDSKRGRQVLIYIHGYYTSFKVAAENALALKKNLHFPGAVVLYSWPSKVTSRLAYVNDEDNAYWSMSHFKNFLGQLEKRFPGMPISFAAHSLGSRFASEGLGFIRHSSCPKCVGRVALYAPDVDADTLYSELLSLKLCGKPPLTNPIASAPVVLYVSNKDLALRQSQQLHGQARAGQAGTELILCQGVDTVDVSYYKGSDRAGHSYQVDPPVIADTRLAFAGVPPTSPARKLKQVSRPGGLYYELHPPEPKAK